MSFTDNWSFETPAEGTINFDDALNADISTMDGLIGGGVITAGENLSVRDVVGIKSDGKAWKVNGSGPTTSIAFVHTAAVTGSPCKIQTAGRIGGFSSLTPGGIIWSDGSGGITQTKPSTNPQQVGIAKSASVIEIQIAPSEDSKVVKSTTNNRTVISGTTTIAGEAIDVVSGLSSIDEVVASLASGYPAYEPTLNEMAVRVQKSGTAGKFHVFVSKLDGSSAGRWVAGTTARDVYWIAIGAL